MVTESEPSTARRLLLSTSHEALLADCYHLEMATLYIRDVPEDIAATLKARAASRGMSLSAYVAAELSKIADSPTNEQITARLRERDRSDGPTREDIVAALDAGRP